MSKNHESIEDVVEADNFEVTDEEINDFIDRGGEAPAYHTILEVWRKVLEPAADEMGAKVTPQWASKMVASYTGLTFPGCNDLRDRYFGKILELASILETEIGTDEECLNYTTPEEDAEKNAGHYKNLLACWQLQFLEWELAWDCTDPYAAIEIAAISEVHKMFLGQQGVVAYLDNIKLEYTEADQLALHELLEERKAKG